MQGPRRAAEPRADESPQLWKQFQLHPQQSPASLTPSTPEGPKHPSDGGWMGGWERRIGEDGDHLWPVPTLPTAVPCVPGTTRNCVGTGRPLAARSPKRETYKRITGKKTLPGIRGLALAHTRACRPSHGVILAVTLCCYILQNVTSGGNQAVYRELCILSHTARDSTDIATKIQLNKTP